MSKKIKILPRSKQVLIEPDPEKSRVSAHGLVTPGNIEQEKKAIGTVLAVGAEIKDIKKGDRVIFGAFAGERISPKESEKEKEVEYILLFDEDVLAFIQD